MEIHSGDEPSSMNDSSSHINGESMGSMGGDNIGGESGNVDVVEIERAARWVNQKI